VALVLSTTVPPDRTSPYAETDRKILAKQLEPKPHPMFEEKPVEEVPDPNHQPCDFCAGTGALHGATESWSRQEQNVPCWVCKGTKTTRKR
jgi:hypothetical protein